jgi:phosphoglycolate phosphatase
MTASNPKPVLLDLDGTLTNPSLGISRCIIYALEEMNIEVPEERSLNSWIGPALLDSFSIYFQSLGIEADAHLALKLYRDRFSEKGLFENEVYDGIEQVLSTLQDRGHPMLLATAKPIGFAQTIIEHYGLAQYLVNAYGAELDGTRSDKTELLQYIIEQESLTPDSCAMVGDRRHDIEAACNHGMQAIGVLWGFGSEEELLKAGASQLVDSPKQLLDCL